MTRTLGARPPWSWFAPQHTTRPTALHARHNTHNTHDRLCQGKVGCEVWGSLRKTRQVEVPHLRRLALLGEQVQHLLTLLFDSSSAVSSGRHTLPATDGDGASQQRMWNVPE
jgi:hypothetical protein